jgi:hypothetical protein
VVLFFKPRHYETFATAVLENGGKANGAGLLNKERALINVIEKAKAA